MGLLSIFQRNKQTAAKPLTGRGGKSPARQAPLANTQNPADTAEAVREARARARRRLMGATVLLLIGVIGFPLLFETQPRPIPVDLPIEIPARNAPGIVDAAAHAGARRPAPVVPAGSAAALPASGPTPESVSYDARLSTPIPASQPASTPPAQRSAFASLAAALSPSAARASDVPASAAIVAPATGGSSSSAAQVKPASKPVKAAAASAAPAASKPTPALHTAGPVLPPPLAASKPSPATIQADTAAAKPSDAAANGGRFVVQVGAFLEDAKVREARAKVEKLGLKTYTQPVDTPTGKRTRVRVGPYASKAEADKIAIKLKAEGLQAVVLVL
jgi:DedD protein